MELTLRLIKLFNIILMSLPIFFVWRYDVSHMAKIHFYFWGDLAFAFFFAIIYVTYARIYDVYRVAYSRISEMFYGQVLAAGFADCFIYLLFTLLIKEIYIPFYFIPVLLLQTLWALIWSRLAHRYYFHNNPPMRTIVIYDEREDFAGLVERYDMKKLFAIEKHIHIKDVLEHLECLSEVQAILLFGVHSHDRNVILKICVDRDIQCYLLPRIGDVIMNGARSVRLFHLPMFLVSRSRPKPEYIIVKRIFDIVSSGIVLLLISPILIGTALAIKVQDGGPVLYKQERLTKDGEKFMVYKFRSMRQDAESDGVARLSSGENDDRITPVGRFIRKCRIDELPQLLNIIGGSMSVVGPRPERPEIAAQYEAAMPEFRLRLQVKAGLTGYAQVYGKYNTTPYDKLQMDLMYIAKANFFDDLRIIFATIRILFSAQSTEGVAEGKVTAA